MMTAVFIGLFLWGLTLSVAIPTALKEILSEGPYAKDAARTLIGVVFLPLTFVYFVVTGSTRAVRETWRAADYDIKMPRLGRGPVERGAGLLSEPAQQGGEVSSEQHQHVDRERPDQPTDQSV